MGYRSDVKYVLEFENPEKRDEFVAVMKIKADENYMDAINGWQLDEGSNRVYFAADYWKWYDSIPIIAAHEALLDEAIEMGGAYVFYRLGENHDDIEERYDSAEDMDVPWDAVVINRSVEFG